MSWEGNLSRLCLRPSCFQPSICNNNINSMTRKSLQVSLQEMHDYVQAWWRSCPPRGSQWAPWRESSSCPQIPALTPCPSQFGPGGGGTWGEERVGLPPWEKGLYLHTKHQLVVMCGQVQEALFSNVPGISVDVKLILQESLLTSWTPRTRTRQAHWRRSSLWPCPSATPRVGCCTQPGDLPPSLEFSHVDLPLNWTLVQWATHHISQTVDTVSLVEGIRWSRVTDLFIVNKVKAMHLKWSQLKYEKTVVMNLPDRSCLRCSRLVWPTGCRSLGVRLVPQFAPAEILKQIIFNIRHNSTLNNIHHSSPQLHLFSLVCVLPGEVHWGNS